VMKSRVNENEFFRQATLLLCGSLDIEKALQRSCEYLRHFLPITEIHLHLLNPDLNEVQWIAAGPFKNEKYFGKSSPLPEILKGQSISRWANMREVGIINRPESSSYYQELSKRLGMKLDRSYLTMRLEIEGSRVGAVTVCAEGQDQYTHEHARLLSLLHEPFAIAMINALKHQEVLRLKEMLADDNRYLQRELFHLSGDTVIGADSGLKGVMEMVKQVAPMDSPVLLLGETGVGKEVIANVLHQHSERKEGPFIKVNCGAIPDTLVDSELFGHEKGAFTGAVSQKKGKFERADKGTLFLDEIGELPLHAQVRLLRVLGTGEIERVGGTSTIPVNVRIISATHQHLEDMVNVNRFREDLWYRLNVFPIMIPPLRQRREDIPLLANYFLERKSAELKIRDLPPIEPMALGSLTEYDWPGNVRELENFIERALIRSRGRTRTRWLELPNPEPSTKKPHKRGTLSLESDNTRFDDATRRHIQHVLHMTRGKIKGPNGAAQLLGLHPSTLKGKMKKLGIQ
jgi:transcriptional regulator with GAF, ATPase, and Fis domain